MIPVLAGLLVATGLGLVVSALRLKSSRRLRDLDAVLREAGARGVTTAEQKDDLRTALARTGRLAERALAGTSVLAKVRAGLARSDWTLSPGEFFGVSGLAGGLGLLLGLVSGSVPLAVLLLVLGLVVPYGLVSRSVSRRRKRFEQQLPDVLELLAATLESGAGIAQALELVVAEADEPAASEFGRVLAATRLGATLVESLQEMADRLDSRDLVYTVQAIAVQQRTGGRLAQVLRIISDFVRGRFELKRELAALTAEGKLSAIILGGLPFAIAGFLLVVSPDYLTPLYTTVPGLVMVAGAGVLMLGAIAAMRKIVSIEV